MNSNPITNPMTRPTRRHVLQTAAAGLVGSVLPWQAQAQAQTTWPTKPVTLVVPFPAGGGTDSFARPLSAQFSKMTGKQLIIDNRGGAGGTVGASIAAKAAPDGYTLFMGAVHHAIAPSMYPRLDYDIEKDFVPLALVANVPQVLVVNPRLIPGDFQAFMAQVRQAPGRLNYGSAGGGTSHHLAGELFKLQTKTFITHIPYRGAGPALQDLIAGNVQMMFDGLGSSATHIKSGRIKALMVSGAKGTPADLQARIVEEMRRATAADELKAIWASNGAETGSLTPAQFGSFVSSEVKRWASVVKASGAKLD